MNAFTGPRDGYGYGFGASYEYKSPLTIGGLPLLRICGGIAFTPHLLMEWLRG